MTMDEVWAEAFRRAGEDGRDPQEHFLAEAREMLAEATRGTLLDRP
jgi:hypothetical protein